MFDQASGSTQCSDSHHDRYMVFELSVQSCKVTITSEDRELLRWRIWLKMMTTKSLRIFFDRGAQFTWRRWCSPNYGILLLSLPPTDPIRCSWWEWKLTPNLIDHILSLYYQAQVSSIDMEIIQTRTPMDRLRSNLQLKIEVTTETRISTINGIKQFKNFLLYNR